MRTNTLIGRRVRYVRTYVSRDTENYVWSAPHWVKEGDEGEIVNVVPAHRDTDDTLVVRVDSNGALVRTSERAVITSEAPKSDNATVVNLLKQILKAVAKKN